MQKRSKKKKRGLDLAKPVERPRMPFGVLLRMFLLGSVAVVASGYAIYRHYFVPRPSMLAPAPAAESASSDFVPSPEIVPVPSN
ncbi:hypothetical protein BH11MYX4_BH11MYX4_60600 [soil metagenome]